MTLQKRNINDKIENDRLSVPIPGNLGDLVGKNSSDVWDKNYENGLVGNGDITVPDVSNPSIGLGGSTSFPVEDNTNGSIDIEYNKTVWSNGDLITADKLNNIEDALEMLYNSKMRKAINKASARSGLLLSSEIIATIASIAVGAGIVLTSDDDIYDIARVVYDNYQGQKDAIETVFKTSVVLGTGGIVKVGKEFLDICKSVFDAIFYDSSSDFSLPNGKLSSKYGIYTVNPPVSGDISLFNAIPGFPVSISSDYSVGDIVHYNQYVYLEFLKTSTISSHVYNVFDVYINGVAVANVSIHRLMEKFKIFNGVNGVNFAYLRGDSYQSSSIGYSISSSYDYEIPYSGGYNWDNNISANLTDNSLGLFVPVNVGSLVGQSGGSTVQNGINNPSYDLPFGGVVTVPGVDNPSIGVGDSTPFPMEDNTSGSTGGESGYSKTVWKDDDLITEEKLNKIENAIAVLNPSYEKTNWNNGDVIIAELLNKIENAIEAL